MNKIPGSGPSERPLWSNLSAEFKNPTVVPLSWFDLFKLCWVGLPIIGLFVRAAGLCGSTSSSSGWFREEGEVYEVDDVYGGEEEEEEVEAELDLLDSGERWSKSEQG